MDSDLEALIRDRSIIISPPDIKAYMRMGLQALDFCHSRWVLHRDVKPNNFLMSATGAPTARSLAPVSVCQSRLHITLLKTLCGD